MENKNLLHSEFVTGTNKNYFLDLKKAENGGNYLVITQSRLIEDNRRERTRMILFERDLGPFAEAFTKMCLQFNAKEWNKKVEEKMKTIEQHPKAFSRWSAEDEMQLKMMFNDGIDVHHIGEQLQRSEKGIQERLKKLGLVQELRAEA